MPFPNPGDVYFSMINVFMESQMHDIEFILNAGYKTLIYDGNFDIICNHSGVLDMIADMQWDGKADYDKVALKLLNQNMTPESFKSFFSETPALNN